MAEDSPQGDPDPLEARVSELETQFEELSTEIRNTWAILVGGLLIVILWMLEPRFASVIVIPVAYYLLYLLFRRFTDYVDL